MHKCTYTTLEAVPVDSLLHGVVTLGSDCFTGHVHTSDTTSYFCGEFYVICLFLSDGQ